SLFEPSKQNPEFDDGLVQFRISLALKEKFWAMASYFAPLIMLNLVF
ncbi:MAG: hypothetical protein ACI9AP_001162, partial [Flavobacteriales bacterium]